MAMHFKLEAKGILEMAHFGLMFAFCTCHGPIILYHPHCHPHHRCHHHHLPLYTDGMAIILAEHDRSYS